QGQKPAQGNSDRRHRRRRHPALSPGSPVQRTGRSCTAGLGKRRSRTGGRVPGEAGGSTHARLIAPITQQPSPRLLYEPCFRNLSPPPLTPHSVKRPFFAENLHGLSDHYRDKKIRELADGTFTSDNPSLYRLDNNGD